jgi:hypothetical protein
MVQYTRAFADWASRSANCLSISDLLAILSISLNSSQRIFILSILPVGCSHQLSSSMESVIFFESIRFLPPIIANNSADLPSVGRSAASFGDLWKLFLEFPFHLRFVRQNPKSNTY